MRLGVLGLPIWIDAAVRFVRGGRGTPAPIAAPEHLVVVGLYRYVGNPMYIGVLAMVVGQGLILGSRVTLIYAAALAAVLHLFVMIDEEPTVRERFGDDYAAYCRCVPRWSPRWR